MKSLHELSPAAIQTLYKAVLAIKHYGEDNITAAYVALKAGKTNHTKDVLASRRKVVYDAVKYMADGTEITYKHSRTKRTLKISEGNVICKSEWVDGTTATDSIRIEDIQTISIQDKTRTHLLLRLASILGGKGYITSKQIAEAI